MKRYLPVILVFAILVFVTTIDFSEATVVRKLGEYELTTQAQAIIIGKVTSITSEWNEDQTKIFTYVTIVPQDFIKGNDTSSEITVKKIGGKVGNIGMLVHGTSVYEEDEEVLLFLGEKLNGSRTVIGLSQGKFSIKSDPTSQRKILVKKEIQSTRTPAGKIQTRVLEIRTDQKIFMDEFLTRIRTILEQETDEQSN